VLSEFARTLVTDFPIQGILDHLVKRIVDILPIDAAGVSLISPTTHPSFISGSDESATRYEHLQTVLNEGPCIAAYDSEEPISLPNLAEDDRFPEFAKQALNEGLAAVFTFPLRNEGRCLGALDLYRTVPGALDDPDMVVAQTLADVTTAYLLNAQARQTKTEFVATVSHELRTPMTSITGYVQLIRQGEAGPLTGTQEKYLNTVQRNCERLTALANDLLMLSSLEPGANSREQKPVDLVRVIDDARVTLQPLLIGRDLDVSFRLADSPVIVRGSEADLGSLVSNLLSNAMKFTQDGGWVRCALHVMPGQARVAVSDNGLGIPMEEQASLFSRFFRSTTAREHAIQGSGLGLTIADSIVRSHGGDIAVVSRHLGGSTFTVNLPMLDEPVAQQTLRPPA